MCPAPVLVLVLGLGLGETLKLRALSGADSRGSDYADDDLR